MFEKQKLLSVLKLIEDCLDFCFLQITRSGRIVPDKEYRHKLFQRTHQRHVRECLAQAIFHKVLEMEVG